MWKERRRKGKRNKEKKKGESSHWKNFHSKLELDICKREFLSEKKKNCSCGTAKLFAQARESPAFKWGPQSCLAPPLK